MFPSKVINVLHFVGFGCTLQDAGARLCTKVTPYQNINIAINDTVKASSN